VTLPLPETPLPETLPGAMGTTRAADLVARRISQAILDGAFPPGTRLREVTLSQQYGVSRTPIREALIMLSTLGLVELSPNRGATVLRLRDDDVTDVYLVRAVLEAEAARLAAGRATEELLATLDFSCDRLAMLHTAPAADQLAADTFFHYAIAEAAGSPRLHAMIRQICAVPEAYRASTPYTAGDMCAAERQHRAVADAIRRRKPGDAAKRMRTHIEWAGRLAVLRLARG
jgi:DNA-binding GntR family transcriptional regulator